MAMVNDPAFQGFSPSGLKILSAPKSWPFGREEVVESSSGPLETLEEVRSKSIRKGRTSRLTVKDLSQFPEAPL